MIGHREILVDFIDLICVNISYRILLTVKGPLLQSVIGPVPGEHRGPGAHCLEDRICHGVVRNPDPQAGHIFGSFDFPYIIGDLPHTVFPEGQLDHVIILQSLGKPFGDLFIIQDSPCLFIAGEQKRKAQCSDLWSVDSFHTLRHHHGIQFTGDQLLRHFRIITELFCRIDADDNSPICLLFHVIRVMLQRNVKQIVFCITVSQPDYILCLAVGGTARRALPCAAPRGCQTQDQREQDCSA